MIPPYAELRCVSNFTFLRGASWPEELVTRAKQLGYGAIAITDECTMAGMVRAHVAAKEAGIKLLVGSQFEVRAGAPFSFIVIATNLNGYGNLCEFISNLRLRSEKGTYFLNLDEIDRKTLADCVVIAVPDRNCTLEQMEGIARWLLRHWTGCCWLGWEQLRRIDDEVQLFKLRQCSELTAVPIVAVGDVHMHVRSRKPLQDVQTATRLGLPISKCGLKLRQNAEQHLRTRRRIAERCPPELMLETMRVADRCDFSLDELKYEYPDEVVPAGHTAASYLREVVYDGAGRRWPKGVPAEAQSQIEHELALIAEMKYEHYFLTVYDIVAFARSEGILCQGRGSAANSVVCYCAGVTEVDPLRSSMLFERFISKERGEPPDIDVDFEHERREEVIQYLYRKYGRKRAALTATIASYRSRGALRDVGKALGLSEDALDILSKGTSSWEFDTSDEVFEEAGLKPGSLLVKQLRDITSQLLGFPRHLGQHTGGFVLTKGLLSRMVPVANATMVDRTTIEWTKDDLDLMGMLKVDVLALGMLTALHKAFDLIGEREGQIFEMQDIPPDDVATFDMICKADTVGVFQVESRAQMSMLPRLKPRTYYDLVIEVAIVRPGPIQGGSIQPYIKRRNGEIPVTYPSPEIERALGRTLGVPLFQEQCMQLAILCAGFTAGEADGLRRAMGAWRRTGALNEYMPRIINGMLERGYTEEFAQSVFEQMKGFSSYGFPESHAASFAILVYASCYVKWHYPAEFLCAMLNSQPLGFYSPSQLVQDAKRHGVVVRAADVLHSNWDCTMEDVDHEPAVRLGLRMVKGLKKESAARIVKARVQRYFESAEEVAMLAQLEHQDMRQLAAADALRTLSGHRRQQVWDAAALRRLPKLLEGAPVDEPELEIEPAGEGEEVIWDYSTLGLTLRSHPLALLRSRLDERRFATAEDLSMAENGDFVQYAGIVTLRQQPETAKGVIFVSLEDETGNVQVIIWPSVRDEFSKALYRSRMLCVEGSWQREGDACSLIAKRLEDLTPLLGDLETASRDFH
ncbi:error-prone DNA polymerase [Roseateles saccharophilus]|uniref:Error-prone DNA polymerase n=1 Tax=Roseateles saccharophilus TaxID=304 RepID=A0A4R3UAS3_ROSSA|nr:error-prone DNA polymerase [Roseateles saccharophilus]MDG0835738.1 error-prone DNA polymerase [Roseateles saccharophilus]TCU84658.1 error-prone DNA polymerase [Roseateles saccharophilus]